MAWKAAPSGKRGRSGRGLIGLVDCRSRSRPDDRDHHLGAAPSGPTSARSPERAAARAPPWPAPPRRARNPGCATQRPRRTAAARRNAISATVGGTLALHMPGALVVFDDIHDARSWTASFGFTRSPSPSSLPSVVVSAPLPARVRRTRGPDVIPTVSLPCAVRTFAPQASIFKPSGVARPRTAGHLQGRALPPRAGEWPRRPPLILRQPTALRRASHFGGVPRRRGAVDRRGDLVRARRTRGRQARQVPLRRGLEPRASAPVRRAGIVPNGG